jgi:hypothetical protein
MQRLLHEPTIRLKGMQEHGATTGHGRLQLVRELFALDEGTSLTDGATGAADGPGTTDNVRALDEHRRGA